ncbi:MAG: hypothetical protein QXS54_03685 [Candidatus Methanomethylicaceae archaeon]
MPAAHPYSIFESALSQYYRIPAPEREYYFDPPRKWRFDYAWPERKVAVEIEGGVWTYGRHNRAATFIKDLEKYNRAVELGWRVLRYTPQQLSLVDTYEQIATVYHGGCSDDKAAGTNEGLVTKAVQTGRPSS